MTSNETPLSTRQDGRVLTVTFDNPPRHFFDEQMSLAFDDLTRAVTRDPTIGSVVFTGHGDRFITHFSVPDLLRGAHSVPFAVGHVPARIAAAAARLATRSRTLDRSLRATSARELVFMARIYHSLDRLNRSDKVNIAAINGLALGMGCILALACDIRLMADDTHIGMPESALAVLAGAGGTQRLTRMVGTSRALDLLLNGRWLTAAEAAELGLIQRVVPRDGLHQHAHATAERLARRSPVTNREVKRSVYDAGTRPLHAALAREAASLITTLATPEAARTLAYYNAHLSETADLTDNAVMQGWYPLLEHGVPATLAQSEPAPPAP